MSVSNLIGLVAFAAGGAATLYLWLRGSRPGDAVIVGAYPLRVVWLAAPALVAVNGALWWVLPDSGILAGLLVVLDIAMLHAFVSTQPHLRWPYVFSGALILGAIPWALRLPAVVVLPSLAAALAGAVWWVRIDMRWLSGAYWTGGGGPPA